MFWFTILYRRRGRKVHFLVNSSICVYCLSEANNVDITVSISIAWCWCYCRLHRLPLAILYATVYYQCTAMYKRVNFFSYSSCTNRLRYVSMQALRRDATWTWNFPHFSAYFELTCLLNTIFYSFSMLVLSIMCAIHAPI